MEGKNWSEFKKYKYKSEEKCNKFFIRWQKTFAKEKSENRTKKLEDIENKVNEIKVCIEKIKKVKNFKN